MSSISETVKSIFGGKPNKEVGEIEEVEETKLSEEKTEVEFVCPICWIVGEHYGGFFVKFSCGHDRTDLPVIIKQRDQWFCRDCDPYRDEIFKFGKPSKGSRHFTREEIIFHVESHREAKQVRFQGAVVREKSYPSIVGKGWNTRAEIVTDRVWALHGKFAGNQGPLLDEYLTEKILGELLKKLPELRQEEQLFQQDLQLNLSSVGKKLIEEKVGQLNIQLEAIKKALPT